jgi:hypothetical protein
MNVSPITNLAARVRLLEFIDQQNRLQEMRQTARLCRCGTCLCCRMSRFLYRVDRFRHAHLP